MPLFRKPETQSNITVNGRRQTETEFTGRWVRRHRLFIECERRLADDPLAQPSAVGSPIGDGHGLEGLVAKIRPLFGREDSLIRWVALRGALLEISMRILDPETAERSVKDLELAMGLEWSPDVPVILAATGQVLPGISESWRSRLTAEQCKSATGVAGSVLIRAGRYRLLENMNCQEAIASPFWMPRAVGLDHIAWSAAALLRMGVAQRLFGLVPEPDALQVPGWYMDPLFAKTERYWDGSDWTSRCRYKDGRQFRELSIPLA